MLVVVGLGNPGPRFHNTRHNVGFLVTDLVAELREVRFRKAFLRPYLYGRAGELLLAKPLTYMNRSGDVLPPLLRRSGGDASQLLVIADNLDLPVGQVRLKRRGQARSHNGLASVMDSLATGDFLRLYVGIGRPSGGESVVDHVLGEIPEDQAGVYEDAFRRAADAVESLVEDSVDNVMNRLNSG